MKIITAICFVIISSQLLATDLGALDKSFSRDGLTDGWDIISAPNKGYQGHTIVVDSQGRILQAIHHLNSVEGKFYVLVTRYLPNGDIDMSFSGSGFLSIENESKGEIGLILGKSDEVFLAYTIENSVVDYDVVVHHIDVNGGIVDTLNLFWDLNSPDYLIDYFEDLVYIPQFDKLAVVASSLNGANEDYDYTIAMININTQTGVMTLDTNFSSDGKNSCFFDHANSSGSQDFAMSAVWNNTDNTVIIGGSVYEGNGSSNDGWNIGFCEFNLQGDITHKWSTQSFGTGENSETMLEMDFNTNDDGRKILIVGSSIEIQNPSSNFSVMKYFWDNIGNQWVIDSGFGGNGTGINSISFLDENILNGVIIEKNGSILLSGFGIDLTGRFAILAKVHSNGKLDKSWGINKTGKIAYSFSDINYNEVSAVAEDSQTQEIYLSGLTSVNSISGSLIANFHNDGIFSSYFEN